MLPNFITVTDCSNSFNVNVMNVIPNNTYTVVPVQSSAPSSIVSNISVINGILNQDFSQTPIISNEIYFSPSTIYVATATATSMAVLSDIPRSSFDSNIVYVSSATAVSTVLLNNIIVPPSSSNLNEYILIYDISRGNLPTLISSVDGLFPSHIIMNENSYSQNQAPSEITEWQSANYFQSQPNLIIFVPTAATFNNEFMPVSFESPLYSPFLEIYCPTHSRHLISILSPSMHHINPPHNEDSCPECSLTLTTVIPTSVFSSENNLREDEVPLESINLVPSQITISVETESNIPNPLIEDGFITSSPTIRTTSLQQLFPRENYLSGDEVPPEPINPVSSQIRLRVETESNIPTPLSENGFFPSSPAITTSFQQQLFPNENHFSQHDCSCEPINLATPRFRSHVQTTSRVFNPARENDFTIASLGRRLVALPSSCQDETSSRQNEIPYQPNNPGPSLLRSALTASCISPNDHEIRFLTTSCPIHRNLPLPRLFHEENILDRYDIPPQPLNLAPSRRNSPEIGFRAASCPIHRNVPSPCLFSDENTLDLYDIPDEPINLAPIRLNSPDKKVSSIFSIHTPTELSDRSEISRDLNTPIFEDFNEEIVHETNHRGDINLQRFILQENVPSSSVYLEEGIFSSSEILNNKKQHDVLQKRTITVQGMLMNAKRKNKEITEELSSAGAIQSDRGLNMPDGDETWRAFYDHPLSAATSAMLNIGGGTSTANEDSPATTLQTSNPVGLICEYYKLPLDKAIVDKYGSLPDFWTAVSASGQASIIGNTSNSVGTNVPVSVLPQAAELLRNRRLSDAGELTPQEVDIYLNRGLVKRETPDNDELVIPSTSAISPQRSPEIIKDSSSAKSRNNSISPENPPVSPLTPLVQIKREQDTPDFSPNSPTNNSSELPPASTVIAQAFSSGHALAQGYESLAAQYASSTLPQYQNQSNSSVYMLASNADYRGLTDYYTEQIRQNLAASASSVPTYNDTTDTVSLVDRYIRQAASYKGISGITVDLSSPDSGIGDNAANHREASGLQQTGEIFDYPELSQTQSLLQSDPQPSRPSSNQSGASRRSWHEYGRNSESDKVNIPKIHSDVGFRYFLESPISTSQRREDDRITYINKGQFYGITLEYITDPDKPLKSSTVKSVVMLMFREEKPHDEELKAWRFWHSRQHSLKQRILDADTKNSTGIIGQVEEVAHNAVAFFWNPLDASAKVNIAVQCLSTDFSNQKGVKGLPLHLQIDTFDDFREGATPHHRGYCQIKVFCDKGAERKTRDEERRAAKRKLNTPSTSDNTMTFPGRKKIDELYHLPCDRSEFYSMSDLLKPPILFSPCDDMDKMTSMDLTFYSTHAAVSEDPSTSGIERLNADSRGSGTFSPPAKRMKLYPTDRVLLYARQESEEAFQAVHVHPPTLRGLANGIENKYNLSSSSVRHIFKRNKKGITVQMDDDIVKHYCNEDTCLIEVIKVDNELCDITLIEI